VRPGEGHVAGHRVLVHLDQTTGGTRATALLDVPQHGESLVVGTPRALQDRALALGEVAFAGAAVYHADALAFAAPAAEGEISSAAHALIGAAGILATEVFNRVQWPSSLTTRDYPFMAYANTRHPANHTKPIEYWPDTTRCAAEGDFPVEVLCHQGLWFSPTKDPKWRVAGRNAA
jgi:hypothetical protein